MSATKWTHYITTRFESIRSKPLTNSHTNIFERADTRLILEFALNLMETHLFFRVFCIKKITLESLQKFPFRTSFRELPTWKLISNRWAAITNPTNFIRFLIGYSTIIYYFTHISIGYQTKHFIRIDTVFVYKIKYFNMFQFPNYWPGNKRNARNR